MQRERKTCKVFPSDLRRYLAHYVQKGYKTSTSANDSVVDVFLGFSSIMQPLDDETN